MDKLKIFLAVAKKHQFWVFCGVMLLTSLGCWWWASRGLAGQFKTRESAIETDFKGAVVPPNSPNDGVIADVKQKDEALKQKVYTAWETLYAEQKKNNPFPAKLLGEDFQKQFEGLDFTKAFEKQQEKPKDPANPKNQLDTTYLERYQNIISKYLPNLRKMIDACEEVAGPDGLPAGGGRPAGGARPIGGFGGRQGGAMMPPPGAMMPPPGAMMPPGARMGGIPGNARGGMLDSGKEKTGTVEWDPGDYLKLQNHFDWQARPTTLEVVLAQEDLRVYEALLRVIKNVNEGFKGQANAPIKRIDALEIGQDSVKAWADSQESVFRINKSGMPGGMMPGGGMPMPGGGMPMPGGGMPMPGGGMPMPGGGMPMPGGGSGPQLERRLVEFRYFDAKGQPLPFDPEYPYAKHPFPEFKMMPIRMSLLMDQRHLPKLLVECANSNMPIDVRRLRILNETIPPLEAAAASTGAGAGMPGAMGGAARPQGRPADSGFGGNSGQESGQFDAPVEIYAVIYIYEPPNREKLGMAPVQNPAAAAAPGAPATVPPNNVPATQPTPPATPGK